MHLKNFSLIETKSGSRSYVLSAAYDMLPTNVVMPEDDKEDSIHAIDLSFYVPRFIFAGIDEKIAGRTD